MKKFMWIWAICIGILTSLYGLIYSFTPMNSVIPGGYLWISLATLAVYFCEGANVKLFVNYACSSLAGLVWGVLGVMAVGYIASLGFGATVAVCAILFIAAFGVVAIHMILLEKTWLNKTSMIFATLAFVFSQNGQNIWQIALSMLGGFILGMAISGMGAFLRKKIITPVSETPEKANV